MPVLVGDLCKGSWVGEEFYSGKNSDLFQTSESTHHSHIFSLHRNQLQCLLPVVS